MCFKFNFTRFILWGYVKLNDRFQRSTALNVIVYDCSTIIEELSIKVFFVKFNLVLGLHTFEKKI